MADRPPPTAHLDGPRIAAATLLLGAAFLPLVRHLSPQVSAFVGVILLLRLAAVRWPALTPGRWILLPLTLAGLGIAFDAYFSFVGRDAGTALLVVMLALKTLELRSQRDLRLLAVLFGFLLVSHFLFDQSAGLALYLGALLVADFGLMADLTARPARRPLRSALRLAGTLTLQALPLALVLFLLFPRLSAPLWNLGNQQQRAVTGMSESMEPGSVAELVVSGEPAFRARFDGQAPPQNRLYWRGLVLWGYDGRRWTRAATGAMPEARPRLAEASSQIGYEVVLEQTNQRWLYALDMPLAAPGTATLDGDFQITAAQRATKATRYRVISATAYNTGPLDLDQEAAGLQLPGNVTPRMRDLVARWQAGSGGPRQVIDRALAHINGTDFYYTLLPPPLGDNPTDQFLFETRRGFCEHYAGAFALLMRVAGIPARIVLGYQGAELAPWGNWYLVTQAEAHAWVEVWLQGQGWVRVDPTAAIAPQRIERGGLFDRLGAGTPLRFQLDETGALFRLVHGLRLIAATAGVAWQDWVLDFSLARQRQMLAAVGLSHLREYGLALAMVVVAAVVLGLLTLALVRGADRREPLERLYQGFCDRLARIGLPRRPSEGPLDYAHRVVAARLDLSEGVEAFMATYLPARYRNGHGPADLKALKAGLRGFRPRRR
jgi:transglutaminase-like putative cysteine protease